MVHLFVFLTIMEPRVPAASKLYSICHRCVYIRTGMVEFSASCRPSSTILNGFSSKVPESIVTICHAF